MSINQRLRERERTHRHNDLL